MHPVTGLALSAGMVSILCFSGCASAARQQRPGSGSVTVGVTTTPAAANRTYRLTIEPAGVSSTVKADAGVFNNDDIPLGEHVIRLGDVPAACEVAGGAERRITISEQRRFAVLRFDVRCK